MAWRNCAASLTLIAEINARWPGRDRASDGTIGDAAHATRTSDHNPWVVVDGTGVVRARDIDKDGIDAPWLAEFLRRRGQVGDPRLADGGYVIFNRRITTPDFRGWKAYTGSNPHTAHLHVSFSRNRAGFDSAAAWGITAGAPPPAAPTPPEDPMPTVDDLLNAEIERAGPGAGGVTTLRAVAAWSDANLRQLRADVVADVRDLLAEPTDGPPALAAADHDAIARRVLVLLTEHPLAPKGT